MGKWTNDIANWNQKWELSNGNLCLRNIPPELEMESDDIPWLSMNFAREDKTVKNSKAPLWSPPIPQTLGMRCITMDYKISVYSQDAELSRLAMLQQQDG